MSACAAMPRPITDPVVQRAIAKRFRKKAEKENRRLVLRELREGALAMRDLEAATGLERGELGLALDQLRIRGWVESSDEGFWSLTGNAGYE